nr:cysteine-rich receptor-like protein kinase [Tanacetum cinerariifolium]
MYSLLTSGLPPPPSQSIGSAQPYLVSDSFEPSQKASHDGPNVFGIDVINGSNHNVPLPHQSDEAQGDKELDELLCSFQNIINNYAPTNIQAIERKKKKQNTKGKKLRVGRLSSLSLQHVSQSPHVDLVDDSKMTKNIGEKLGFLFDSSPRGFVHGLVFLIESALLMFMPLKPLRKRSLFGYLSKLLFPPIMSLGSSFEILMWLDIKKNNLGVVLIMGKLILSMTLLLVRASLTSLCVVDDLLGLTALRMDIKRWTANRVKDHNRSRDNINKNLLEWDKKAEEGLINEFDIIKREGWLLDLHHLDQLHKDDLKQKCRFRWAGCMLMEFGWTSQMILKRLPLITLQLGSRKVAIRNPMFRRLSSDDAFFLELAFSLEKVKATVWDCAGSKASGPDGFNFNFIKTFWEIIKVDFWNCIRHFESTGELANGCNLSFIVLIPKKLDPIGFSDYRPISLIGCVYKVISKLLASRLASVIGSIIGPNQSAFINGRQILDGCLIANEIIRIARMEDHKLLLFKVDFEKDFDSVNWNFLLSIMRQMGFKEK